MADVFVSYKKEDRAVAERLVRALRAAGKSVWWDDALNPAQAWDAMIEAEIAAARHVIVLWTPRSVQSDWVRSEAHYAQDHGKLVPVIAEPCTLPIAFMLRQAVDLSSGRFDDGDPNWPRLLGWLSGEAPEPPQAREAAAQAAVPVKALTGVRWLGPTAKRPGMLYGALGLAAVLVLGLGAMVLSGPLGLGKPPQPSVVIDPLTVSARGLPEGLSKAIIDEMFTGFSSSSRISPVISDGKRRPDAYQLTGDVMTSGDKAQVFAKLYAPHVEAPVITFKLEQPAASKALPLEFGIDLAHITRCVATASDSAGSKLTILPPEAIAPWAKFCQQMLVNGANAQARAATLRTVVAAAPGFANGWSNLAESLFFAAFDPGADKKSLLTEAEKAADRALSIDPKTAKALQTKGWLVLGLAGPTDQPTLLGRLHNFDQWEALAKKSVTVRPSDCGCEGPNYAGTLIVLGRPSAGVPFLEKSVSTEPSAAAHAIDLAENIALTGNAEAADKQLADLAEKWPDHKSIPRMRLRVATWRQDWKGAKAFADALPNVADKQTYLKVLDALARGDAAAAKAAGSGFLATTRTPQAMSWLTLSGLAIAGYTDEAVDALEIALAHDAMFDLSEAFTPPFSAARRTARFAALAEKTGLMDYWKSPGHRPDFCNEPNPAALCAAVSKS